VIEALAASIVSSPIERITSGRSSSRSRCCGVVRLSR
jgi:hypothetical protein